MRSLATSLALLIALGISGPAVAQKKVTPSDPKIAELEAGIEAFMLEHIATVENEDVEAYLDDILHNEERKALLRASAETLFAEYDIQIDVEQLLIVDRNAKHARVVMMQRTFLTDASGTVSETLTRLNISLRNLDGQWRIATTERRRLDP